VHPSKRVVQANHGTPIRQAVEAGFIERGQLYQVGLRGPWGNKEEGEFSSAFGAKVFSVDMLSESGIAATASSIKEAIGTRAAYISFDIDAVDPAFAPGTGTPVPGGLTSREALDFIRRLAGIHLVGMDVVEIAPSLDHADATSLLGAFILYEGLAILAKERAA